MSGSTVTILGLLHTTLTKSKWCVLLSVRMITWHLWNKLLIS